MDTPGTPLEQLPLIPAEKRCTKCGGLKPLDEFHHNKLGRHGRKSHCKACLHRPRPTRYEIQEGGPREETRLLRMEGLKRCTRCRAVKSLADFPRAKRSGDGRSSHCLLCRRAANKDWQRRNPEYAKRYRESMAAQRSAYNRWYREHNVERERERHRLYAEAHRDLLRTRRQAYWQQHRERLAAAYRQWYQVNREHARRLGRERMQRRRIRTPDAVKAYDRQWRLAHPDEERASDRRCYQRHKLRYFAQARKRRALRANAEGSYTQQEWIELCAGLGSVCLSCGAQGPLTADHVIPLSRGGSDYIGNIQPLCKSCNSIKGARTIDFRPAAMVS